MAAESVSSWKPTLGVVSRVAAAVFGGYAFAAVAAIFLSFILPMPRGEAVMTATLASFAIYVGAVVWVFAARTSLRAWAGLLLPGAVMGALILLLKALA